MYGEIILGEKLGKKVASTLRLSVVLGHDGGV